MTLEDLTAWLLEAYRDTAHPLTETTITRGLLLAYELGAQARRDTMPDHSQIAYDAAIERIARVCHEANRAYCQTLDDQSQTPWAVAPAWQRHSAIEGVAHALDNPEAPPSAQHEAWLKSKQADGWVYGPEKDESRKTHPCCVPYEDLPLEQQRKDALFKAIALALRP